MQLSSGTRFGPYEILSLIGSGGMGEVYRARDTTLDRDVAVKILPEAFAMDPDRLARFEREAKVLASLNHPYLAAIYDFEQSGAVRALVLELVEGPTLADRLAHGPLPLDEALPIARQIAEALEAAHEQGVIHRDLKPANIKLRPDGMVKVLDFGLARVFEKTRLPSDLTQSPTVLSPAPTLAGVILGTAAYMSPEQARGKAVDKRTDIWAFGCVLFEMLTGQRLFDGETTTQFLADVINGPIDLDRLPPDTPTRVRDLIKRCLDRDVTTRLRDIGEARVALANPGRAENRAQTTTLPRKGLPWTVAVAIVAALGGWAIAHFRQPTADDRVVRFQIDPPEGGQFPLSGDVGGIAVSPDGKTVAYVANVNGKSALWVRPLNGATGRPLPGTERASHPFWSADSKSIAFFNIRRLQRVEVAGGEPLTICDAPTLGGGGAWPADGQIVFGLLDSPLFRVPSSGGKPTPLTTLNVSRGEIGHYQPQVLPEGRILYWVRSDKPENTGVYAASLARPDERVRLLTSDATALYAVLPDGKSYLLWVRGETLVAQEFDAATLKLAGEPHPVAGPVSKFEIFGQLNASIGTGGILLYSASGSSKDVFTWFDRAGRPLGTVGDPDSYSTFRLSPDGHRAVVSRHRSGDNNLFLLDMATRLSSRFTLTSNFNIFPIWSPNGRTVMFTPTRSLFRKDSDGAGNEQPVVPSQNPQYATDWSGDGRLVLYNEVAPGTQDDIWTLRVTPEGKTVPSATGGDSNPRPYLTTPANEREGRFSPEPSPHWVAYTSDDSGQSEVYIAAFPDPRNKVRISTGGGEFPQWAPHGRELFYVSPGGKLMAVSLKLAADSVEPSAPHELFLLPGRGTVSPYDVAPDGQRFLVRATAQQGSQPLTVIVNWPTLLKSGAAAP